jgi:hypothetical protein
MHFREQSLEEADKAPVYKTTFILNNYFKTLNISVS